MCANKGVGCVCANKGVGCVCANRGGVGGCVC